MGGKRWTAYFFSVCQMTVGGTASREYGFPRDAVWPTAAWAERGTGSADRCGIQPTGCRLTSIHRSGRGVVRG
jgi:hypothetical protein